ncbi:MAG: hypothetical protein GYB31_18220 [Bacteroidetes bacterium]|nr:hypothetical protein [Bacteroidota bacterium]
MKTKRTNSLILLLLLLTIFGVSTNAFAQVAQTDPAYRASDRQSDVARAEAAMAVYPEAVLVVKLPSESKKIQVLQSRITQGSANTAEYKEMLEETKKDRDDFAFMLMSAFKDAYDFSEVLFVWDTTSFDAGSSKIKACFLDEYLQADPQQSLDTTKPHFFGYIGQTAADNSNGVNALIVCESNMEPLESPFPYCAPFDFGIDTIRAFLFKGVTEADLIRKAIGKWNKALYRYQEKLEF